MAKGQQRSNREVRKPKQEKAKAKPAPTLGSLAKQADLMIPRHVRIRASSFPSAAASPPHAAPHKMDAGPSLRGIQRFCRRRVGVVDDVVILYQSADDGHA